MVLVILLLIIGLSGGMPENRVIQASEVETIIRAGEPAEFDDCTIVGDLNLSGLMIERSVHFNRTIFQDSVMFNSTAFNGDAYFVSSIYNGDASFWSSAFNGTTDFGSSAFNGTADFEYSTFNGDAYFERSAFNGDAYFGSTAFNGSAYFGSTVFNGSAYFEGLTFNSIVSFWNLTFNGTADFKWTVFYGPADFRDSAFNGDANFEYSTFNGDANFWSSVFNGTVDFEYNTFGREAEFSEVVFKRYTSFNSSQFKGDALFENTTIQGTLSITKARYDKLFIRWYSIKGGLVYDDAVYMSLLKNFKDLGYFEDYDSCYLQYRKEHRGQPWPGIGSFEASVRKVLDIFLEYFYGYGKKPLLPLAWSLGIMLVFGIYWRSIGQKKQKIILDEYLPLQNKPNNKVLMLINPFIFSATVFLSGTKLFVDPPEVPDMPGNSQSIIKFAFTLERVLGAFFSILFFLAISGTVVR
jgi:hypothetical protein